jgi:HK97 family phage major capsid protein
MADYVEQIKDQREAALAKAVALCDVAAAESRELTDAEQVEYKKSIERADALEVEIKDKESLEEKRSAAKVARASVEGAFAPKITVTRAETPYTRSGQNSFYKDVFAASRGDVEARERLTRNEKEVIDLKPEFRDGTTGSGSFGSFIAPVYLIDEYAARARAGRPVANAIRNVGAPTATSISIPRVTTGSTVASQASQNGSVSETDLVTTLLTRSTVTIAGQQDVSIQSLELANGAQVDRIIFEDLRAAYDAELDRQVLNGTGSDGQLLGLLNVDSINAVTYTDASPTAAELYPKFVDAVQRIASNRFQPAQAVILHPRRWAFLVAALDGQNRPLVTPVAPYNGTAAFGELGLNGVVGSIFGLPIIADANIPTNLGAGTNEDVIAVVRTDDHLLLEGALRTRVLEDVGSGTLTVRLQAFAYANYFAGRYPSGISTVTGTGLVTPTF